MNPNDSPILKFSSKVKQLESIFLDKDANASGTFNAHLKGNWFQIEYFDCKLFCEYSFNVTFVIGKIFRMYDFKIEKFFTSEESYSADQDKSKTAKFMDWIRYTSFGDELRSLCQWNFPQDLQTVFYMIKDEQPMYQEVALGLSGYETYDFALRDLEDDERSFGDIIIEQNSEVSELLNKLDKGSENTKIQGNGWLTIKFIGDVDDDVEQTLLIQYYISLIHINRSEGLEKEEARIIKAVLSGHPNPEEQTRNKQVKKILDLISDNRWRLQKKGLPDIPYISDEVDSIIDCLEFGDFTVVGKPKTSISFTHQLEEIKEEDNLKQADKVEDTSLQTPEIWLAVYDFQQDQNGEFLFIHYETGTLFRVDHRADGPHTLIIGTKDVKNNGSIVDLTNEEIDEWKKKGVELLA